MWNFVGPNFEFLIKFGPIIYILFFLLSEHSAFFTFGFMLDAMSHYFLIFRLFHLVLPNSGLDIDRKTWICTLAKTKQILQSIYKKNRKVKSLPFDCWPSYFSAL